MDNRSFVFRAPVWRLGDDVDTDAILPQGDWLEVDCISGKIHHITRGQRYTGSTLPAFMLEILTSGGLVPYMEKRLTGR